MSLTALLIAAYMCAVAFATTSVRVDSASMNTTTKWLSFKKAFGKSYTTDAEEAKAFDAFETNEAIINAHNAKNLTFTLGHNKFSDLSWEEFHSIYVGTVKKNPHLRRAKNYDQTLSTGPTADAVDWVTAGAVTKVKDQGQCGSCWAFSTTGSLEGAYQISNGQLVSFSEQQLVSCDKVDDGCSGGLMENAFDWIKKNGGICTEDSYPYESSSGSSGSCKTACDNAATVTGYTDVTPKDEKALLAAVTKGPVSVAIEADKSAFQLYSGGVFTSASSCGTQLDHGVLAVGYGTDGSNNYWKVKNSWVLLGVRRAISAWCAT